MNTGEVLRRTVFNLLDASKGGKLQKLKEVNKREIVEGVTEEYMERRLKTLLDYVKKNSSFYRKHPEWKELKDFPVMTKGDFIEHYDEVLVDHYQEQGKLYRLSTSGSTGTPFTVLCDGDKLTRINLNFISCMELNGFRMGMKRGEFRAWIKGKNTISKWKSFKNNLIMVDISNMGDESLEKICRDIEKKKIQVLVPYSSALTALTQYLKRTKRDISRWQVEMIYTMGEALPQETYDLAKELFGFTPVRTYGNNENGFIAVQLGEDRHGVGQFLATGLQRPGKLTGFGLGRVDGFPHLVLDGGELAVDGRHFRQRAFALCTVGHDMRIRLDARHYITSRMALAGNTPDTLMSRAVSRSSREGMTISASFVVRSTLTTCRLVSRTSACSAAARKLSRQPRTRAACSSFFVFPWTSPRAARMDIRFSFNMLHLHWLVVLIFRASPVEPCQQYLAGVRDALRRFLRVRIRAEQEPRDGGRSGTFPCKGIRFA